MLLKFVGGVGAGWVRTPTFPSTRAVRAKIVMIELFQSMFGLTLPYTVLESEIDCPDQCGTMHSANKRTVADLLSAS